MFSEPDLHLVVAELGRRFQNLPEYPQFATAKIIVTELSLPKGGLLDFKNEWEVPHMLHRKGRSADISSRAWYSEKKQDWAPNKDVLDAVKKACDQGPVEVRDASGNVVRVIEFKCVPEGDHFHVELLPKDPPSPSNPPCPPRFLSSFCPFKAFPNGAKCN
ncbi:MAG: hypothetical protein ACP5NF_08085 [Thermoanaerobaculum sp.]